MSKRWDNITGVLQNLFGIGGNSGVNLKNSSGTLEARNAGDSAYVRARALEIQTSNGLNDVVTLLDLKANTAGIEFDFTGASAPAPNANLNKFGFCHTSGGAYTAGDVVYDNGTSLLTIPTEVVHRLTTTTTITGTISLIANGFYVNDSAGWTLKGDGSGSSTGTLKIVKLSYAYTDATIDSTTDIPSGSVVLDVVNNVKTAFDGTAPTIAVTINGSTPLTVMSTAESDVTNIAEYEVGEINEVAAANAGKARITITPDSSTVGAGDVYVSFVTPLS